MESQLSTTRALALSICSTVAKSDTVVFARRRQSLGKRGRDLAGGRHGRVACRVGVTGQVGELTIVGVDVLLPELGRLGVGCRGAYRLAVITAIACRSAGTLTVN